jgi:hypothetical protein
MEAFIMKVGERLAPDLLSTCPSRVARGGKGEQILGRSVVARFARSAGEIAQGPEAAMTQEKDFKRAVRAYALRTGRSYASARRLLVSRSRGGEAMENVAFKLISKPEAGFNVRVPEGWAEFPPVLSHSPYEVARFAYRDHTDHLCIVFRLPGSPGLDPRGTAERSQAALGKKGFGNFALTLAEVGRRPGVRLTFDKTTEAGLWASREYFVSAGSLVYCLGLGTGDPDGDAATFDAMAAEFEVTS